MTEQEPALASETTGVMSDGTCNERRIKTKKQDREQKMLEVVHEEKIESLETLQKKHLRICQEQAPWQQVWQLLLESPCFDRICQKSACSVQRQCGLPRDCLQDLKQESLLYFARLVRKNPDLRFRPELGSYATWLSTLLYGCCRKAVRQFRDRHRQREELHESSKFDFSFLTLDQRIDLIQFVNQLDDPLRVVILLRSKGYSVSEIADRIQRCERTTFRLLEKGTEAIERLLSDD